MPSAQTYLHRAPTNQQLYEMLHAARHRSVIRVELSGELVTQIIALGNNEEHLDWAAEAMHWLRDELMIERSPFEK